MNITVLGTGYVGLVTGTCFAEMGNSVTCVDIDKTKIENLRRGILPIYEPGLDAMVKENQEKGTLKFTTSIEESLQGAEVCFIAVGTAEKVRGVIAKELEKRSSAAAFEVVSNPEFLKEGATLEDFMHYTLLNKVA